MSGYRLSVTVFIAILLLTACNNDPLKDLDVSGTNINYSSGRLDKEILHADFSNPGATSQTLYHKYGSFYCAYLEDILRIGPCRLDSSFMIMFDFVNNEFVSAEFKAIEAVHDQPENNNISKYDQELEEALKRWHHYFPDSLVPRVVYFNSAYNASIYSTDSIIGIALDFYLGKDHEIVQQLEPELFPNYVKENMQPDFLVPDAIKDWSFRKTNRYAPVAGEGTLLDQLIYIGKVMYLLDAMLPNTPEHLKMNWTEEELAWALANEGNTWKELARQEVFFNKSAPDNQKWIVNGPFTNAGAIPQESPPQLGVWMGLQFVRAYMKEHPDITLTQLLEEKNNNLILQPYQAP